MKKHTEQITALDTPEKQPALTKAQARFAQWLAIKASVVVGAVWAFVQWVLTNWGHLLPLLTAQGK